MAKRLGELLKSIDPVRVFGKTSSRVTGIVDDSRRAQKGTLFVAVKGSHVDAHKFIKAVIKKGVVAVVGEVEPEKKWLEQITYIKVKDSREALGLIASAWYKNPSKNLKVIGVTGTDGKTTTATIVYHTLKTAGKKVGLITSLSARIGNKEYDTGFHVTSPEPLELQKFLSKMVDQKCEYAVLEVTSHGLAQARVTGINFDTAVLTNITHEHLDYHKSFKDYRDTKGMLFSRSKRAVLNRDDDSYNFITSIVSKTLEVVSYSLGNKKADLIASNIRSSKTRTEFDVTIKARTFNISTSLVGEYNVSNILAAVATAKIYGVSNRIITKALRSFKGIEGRLEEIKNDKEIRIIIDFAHTPNSLENVLKLLKKQSKGKLIVVFGCAGERDVEKRKLMPKTSLKYADMSIFTAEDPRSEDVNEILEIMTKSAKVVGGRMIDAYNYRTTVCGNSNRGNKCYMKIQERGKAISFAINKSAKNGDTVAVLGKGHEKSMAYDGIEYPWSDHEAVQMALKGKVKEIIRK